MQQLKITERVTGRESPSMDKYLNEIGKIKLISSEEEVSLARRIHKGDLEARDCLINANLRFVISVAKQYQNLGLSLADLINEGNLGLIEAAQRFDETRGFKFISYAVWWIRQSIIQAVAENMRIVRLPLNRINHINKIKKSIKIFMPIKSLFIICLTCRTNIYIFIIGIIYRIYLSIIITNHLII